MQVVPVEYILAKEKREKKIYKEMKNFFLTLNVSVTTMRIMMDLTNIIHAHTTTMLIY